MKEVKVITLGDSGVGKTSIINSILENDNLTTIPNVSVGIFKKNYESLNKQIILWDTAGQEQFKALSENYVRNSSISLLIYDITEEFSFENLDFWIGIVNSNNQDSKIIIVGNKIDLDSKRVISSERLKNKSTLLNCKYLEVSAKEKTAIKELESYILELSESENQIEISTQPIQNTNSINCC